MFRRPLFLCALALAFFCFIFSLFNFDYEPSYYDGEAVICVGKIYKIESKTKSKYIFLENVQLGSENESKHFNNVLITIYNEDYENYDLKIGSKIKVSGKYKDFNVARNNGNFDEKNYYHSLNVFIKIQASDIEQIGKAYSFIGQTLFELKNKIITSFENSISNEKAGIFEAIVTGNKSEISDDTKSLYQESGIAHILAISGLHISLLGMGVFKILRKKLKFVPASVISIIFMLLFCLMCGASASALRATIMFVIVLTAKGLGKTYDLLNGISIAMILLFLSNPYIIRNNGFLLSFGAVLAIGLIGNIIIKFFETKKIILQSLIISISITVFTAPIIALTYYQIPLYSVFLNLCVIPLMSFVLGSGLFSGIIGLFSLTFGKLFLGIGFYLLYFIEGISEIFLYFPNSIINTGNLSVIEIIFYYLILFACAGIVFLYLEAKRKDTGDKIKTLFRNKLLKTLYAAIFLTILILILVIKTGKNNLQIFMFDVDQGDGIVINNPGGNTYMIDGGSTGVDEVYKYRLKSALKYEGITKIDYEIITHPDTDHISGVLEILNDNSAGKIEISNILIPEIDDNDNYNELIETAKENGVNVINIHSGMEINDGKLNMKCLHPSKDYVSEDVNSYSTVLEVTYGNFNALFVGDLDADGESKLLENESLKKIDLLKVAHHGSKYSSTEEFLNKVQPQISIISAGVDNSYGHPSDETLARLKNIGSEIYCTKWDGEIIVETNGESVLNVKTKF